jgi:hypothetical protein
MSEYDKFCFILLKFASFDKLLLLFVLKSGEGNKELICTRLHSFGQ